MAQKYVVGQYRGVRQVELKSSFPKRVKFTFDEN